MRSAVFTFRRFTFRFLWWIRNISFNISILSYAIFCTTHHLMHAGMISNFQAITIVLWSGCFWVTNESYIIFLSIHLGIRFRFNTIRTLHWKSLKHKMIEKDENVTMCLVSSPSDILITTFGSYISKYVTLLKWG